MGTKKIRQLLVELNAELEKADIDEETRALMRELDKDIQELPEASGAGEGSLEDDENPLFERAKQLETRFAAEHPTAEMFLREIADALGKLGI